MTSLNSLKAGDAKLFAAGSEPKPRMSPDHDLPDRTVEKSIVGNHTFLAFRDVATGTVVEELWFNPQHQQDRTDGGPALVGRDAATGKVTGEEWWKNGQRGGRTDGGPDCIQRDPTTGVVTYEAWHRDDVPDRADGPARIRRDPKTGNVTLEEFWKNGKFDHETHFNPVTGKEIKLPGSGSDGTRHTGTAPGISSSKTPLAPH
jgi:hypothetical protein